MRHPKLALFLFHEKQTLINFDTICIS